MILARTLATRRHGLTLTEALVALFVAALGLISLLTLFPLGALQMGQALKDDRCAQTAYKADTLMRVYWRSMVENNIDPNLTLALTDPNNGSTFMLAGGPPVTTGNTSFPLFVDPLGWRNTTSSSPSQAWLAGAAGETGLPRRTMQITMSPTNINPAVMCSMLDDMNFEVDTAVPVPNLERSGRYNWSAVIQRPQNAPNNTANLTILVFDKRSPSYVAPNEEQRFVLPAEESAAMPYSLKSYSAGTSSAGMTLGYRAGSARPTVTKNRWVMLHTISNKAISFYRIISVNDETADELQLELQTPVSVDHADTTTTRAIVFGGLAEVFERPPLSGN